MTSAKTDRSRASPLKDNGLHLDDGLTFFKSDNLMLAPTSSPDVLLTRSVLPEDEWFNEVCQDAMERPSGKPNGLNEDRDLVARSPPFQQSVSSARSHGSS